MKTILNYLISTNDRFNRPQQFINAVEMLDTGIVNKMIYNARYNEAKDIISRGSEVILDNILQSDQLWGKGLDVFSYLSTAQITKLAKEYSKNGYNPILTNYANAILELAEIVAKMKEVKKYIIKGREPSNIPAIVVVPEVDVAGTCPICGGIHKLKNDGTLYHHGFQRPGNGYIHGDCFAVGYQPYEVSNKANIDYAVVLESHLMKEQETLIFYNSDKCKSLFIMKNQYDKKTQSYKKIIEEITNDMEQWKQVLRTKIYEVEGNIRLLEYMIKNNTLRITSWKKIW